MNFIRETKEIVQILHTGQEGHWVTISTIGAVYPEVVLLHSANHSEGTNSEPSGNEFKTAAGAYACLSCLKKLHEIKMLDLRDCITALKTEVAELRTALSEVLARESMRCCNYMQNSSDAWSTVGSRGKRMNIPQLLFTQSNLGLVLSHYCIRMQIT